MRCEVFFSQEVEKNYPDNQLRALNYAVVSAFFSAITTMLRDFFLCRGKFFSSSRKKIIHVMETTQLYKHLIIYEANLLLAFVSIVYVIAQNLLDVNHLRT